MVTVARLEWLKFEAGDLEVITGVGWLSVSIGNVHGAISGAARHATKIEARLNIEHLKRISEAVNLPLVLHGGTGIKKEHVLAGVRHGIAKINVATAIRQPYEKTRNVSVAKAQEVVYVTVLRIITEELEIAGSADRINLQCPSA